MIQLAMMCAGDQIAQVILHTDFDNSQSYRLVFEDGLSDTRLVIDCGEHENDAFKMFAAWIAADEPGIETLPGYKLLVKSLPDDNTRKLFLP